MSLGCNFSYPAVRRSACTARSNEERGTTDEMPCEVPPTVALLHHAAARHPEDARLRALVAELDGADSQFSAWRDAHDVEEKRHGAKTYLHPTAGELALTYEAFPMPDDGDQILTIYTVQPGTVDAERLAGLALRSAPPGA